MKFLVMSDTHGDAEIIKTVIERHPNMDAIFHCGDSELPYNHPYLDGVKKVRGNCDSCKDYPNEVQYEKNGIKIFMTHGHLFNVKSTLMNLYYRAKEVKANVVFFGHSHLLGIEEIDNIIFINPGSLRKPRGIKEKTYIVIEVEKNEYNIIAYTDTGEELCKNQIILNE